MRGFYWSKSLKKLGTASSLGRNTIVGSPELLEIGDRTVIIDDCAFGASGSKGIWIGNDVMIARGTYFHAANHKIDDLELPISRQGTESIEIPFNNKTYGIVIEDNVWIGSNVVITSGTHLGTGSVVSAGCVVSGDYPPFSVLAGNPARVVYNRKKRFGEE